VRVTGFEPARYNHQILSLARLPIPPYPQNVGLFSHAFYLSTAQPFCQRNCLF
jgi:hypothetical protein